MPARGPRRGVSPKTLTAVAIVILLAAVATVVWLLVGRPAPRQPATEPSVETTGTASLRDEFPLSPAVPLASPLGIAWTGKVLAVAEADAGAIALFTPEGEAAGRLTVPVAAGASKAYPVALAVLDADRLVVADTAGNRVVTVAIDPKSPAKPLVFGSSAKGAIVKQPTAVTVAEGEVFVADGVDHDIKVFAADGRFKRAIGSDLEPPLTFVGGMAVSGGRLYVTDSNAGRGLILDARSGGLAGSLQARMQLPRAVAAGPDGTVFVCDRFGRAILQFDANGRLVLTIGATTIRGGTIESPQGITVDAASGELFVSDVGSGTIKGLTLTGAK